jgi:hypothetical protein
LIDDRFAGINVLLTNIHPASKAKEHQPAPKIRLPLKPETCQHRWPNALAALLGVVGNWRAIPNKTANPLCLSEFKLARKDDEVRREMA